VASHAFATQNPVGLFLLDARLTNLYLKERMNRFLVFLLCMAYSEVRTQETQDSPAAENQAKTADQGQAVAEGLDSEQRNIADILNYSQISIEIISEYNNRMVLDREYSAILNNFNLRQIPDEKIVQLMTDLMDCLTDARLTDREREMLDIQHARKLKAALPSKQDFVRAGISTAQAAGSIAASAAAASATAGASLIKTLPGSLSSSVDALGACGAVAIKYLDYQDQVELLKTELHDANWDIDSDVISKVNEINKTMLSTSWSLYNEYDVPEVYRLTQSDISSLIEINRERDLLKRYRLLSRPFMLERFSRHAPYWYYTGSTAHEIYIAHGTEEFRKSALAAYEKYERNRSAIFKKDEMLASCILGKAQLLDPETQRDEIVRCLQTLEKNPPENWPSITTLALLHAKLGMHEKARVWAQHNVDSDSINSVMHKQMMGRILSDEGDFKALEKLTNEMFTKDRASVMDVLDMIGTAPRSNVVKLVGGQLTDVSCTLFQKKLRDDVLSINVPLPLHLQTDQVHLVGGNASFDPESGLFHFLDDTGIPPENIGSSDDKETVFYEFKTPLVDDWIRGDLSHLQIVFSDQGNSVAFLLSREGIERMDDEGKAITANVSLITINGVQYFARKNSLVEAGEELRNEFLGSVEGVIHAFSIRDAKVLEAQSRPQMHAYILENGDDPSKESLYKALLEEDSMPYLAICGLFGEHKGFHAQLSVLPFSELSLTVGEDFEEKMVKASNLGLSALKKVRIVGEVKGKDLRNNKPLELVLPGRWALASQGEQEAIVLRISEEKTCEGKAMDVGDGAGTKVVFADCFNAADWKSSKIDEVSVVLGDKDKSISLSFKVKEGKIDQGQPVRMGIGGADIDL